MAKITVQANGMTFTVETDATTFSIAGVEFKFTPPVSAPPSKWAKFTYDQVSAKKINCIKAVRIGSQRIVGSEIQFECGLAVAKNTVEQGLSFEVKAENLPAFENHCRNAGIVPTYL